MSSLKNVSKKRVFSIGYNEYREAYYIIQYIYNIKLGYPSLRSAFISTKNKVFFSSKRIAIAVLKQYNKKLRKISCSEHRMYIKNISNEYIVSYVIK